MQTAVDEIGGELHSQYSLTYEPTGTKATGYHVIQVQVNRANLKVRARRILRLAARTLNSAYLSKHTFRN